MSPDFTDDGFDDRPDRLRPDRFGRKVACLEDSLRQAVEDYEVVCDECLKSKQPILHTSARVRTAESFAPLCAGYGRDCQNQKKDSMTNQTTSALRFCKLYQSTNPRYCLDKHQVSQYAAQSCLCKACYSEINKADIPLNQSTGPISGYPGCGPQPN